MDAGPGGYRHEFDPGATRDPGLTDLSMEWSDEGLSVRMSFESEEQARETMELLKSGYGAVEVHEDGGE